MPPCLRPQLLAASTMSGKQRDLPSWMGTGATRGSEDGAKKASSSAPRKRRTQRVTTYVMNEQELVQTALTFLAEKPEHRVQAKTKVSPLKTVTGEQKKRKEAPRTCCNTDISEPESPERTYISETDLDVAEEETLPYGVDSDAEQKLEGASRPSSNSSGAGVSAGHSNGHVDNAQEQTHDEDHALQLVREIFFR